MNNFHRYLIGRQCTRKTNPTSLTWLLSFKEPEVQSASWIGFLKQYNYQIEHRKGKLHGNAYGVSRRPCTSMNCKYCDKVKNIFERANGKDKLICIILKRKTVDFKPEWQSISSEDYSKKFNVPSGKHLS